MRKTWQVKRKPSGCPHPVYVLRAQPSRNGRERSGRFKRQGFRRCVGMKVLPRFVVVVIAVAVMAIGLGVKWKLRQPKEAMARVAPVVLPPGPYSAEHLPVLQRKLAQLKDEVERLREASPRPPKAARKKIDRVWEEIFYTPEFYPEFVKVRTIECAKVVEYRPELAAHLALVKAYQDGRYAIATDRAIADKATAIAALEKGLGPGFKNPEFAREKQKFLEARRAVAGDVELEPAHRTYQRFRLGELTKRLPNLTDYYRGGGAARCGLHGAAGAVE